MIGKIETVELRDVWPHEAHDLTPWLRDNISITRVSMKNRLYFKF